MMTTKGTVPPEYRCFKCRKIGDHWMQYCHLKKAKLPRLKKRTQSIDNSITKLHHISANELQSTKDKEDNLSEEIERLTRKIHNYEDEVKRLGQENKELKEKHIQQSKNTIQTMQKTHSQQSLHRDTKISSLENELKSLKQQNELLSTENQRIKHESDQHHKQQIHKDKEFKELQSKVNTEIKGLQSQNASLLNEKEQLLKSIESNKTLLTTSMDELDKKMSLLRQSLHTEKEEHKTAQEQVENWMTECTKYHNELHELQVKHTHLKHDKEQESEANAEQIIQLTAQVGVRCITYVIL